MVRLSLALGRTRHELERDLTAEDLALYQAAVEVDGPWWGEREAAYLRQLCSVQAAAAGADLPPDRFGLDWVVGPAAPAGEPLLDAATGLRVFAARHGLAVEESPR